MRAVVSVSLVLAASCGFEPGRFPSDGSMTGDMADTPATTCGTWFDPAWTRRKLVTISAAVVDGGPFASFPLLVNLGADLDLAAGAQPDGDDIVFTLADGVTPASHELELFGGQVLAWVKVDLSSAADTQLYVYFRNLAAADQPPRTAVWTDSYLGVWHFAQNPTGTAPQVIDSTALARHATSRGMLSADHVAGRIGGALDFDATNNGLDAPSATLGPAFTYDAWINPDTITSWHCIFNNSPSYNRWFGIYLGDLDFYSGTEHIQPTSITTSGGWYHVAVTYDGSQLRQYLDGAAVGSPLSLSYSNATSPTQIGYTSSSIGEWFGGQIDEVRISSVARSAGFLATQVRNVTMPSLIQLAAVETCP